MFIYYSAFLFIVFYFFLWKTNVNQKWHLFPLEEVALLNDDDSLSVWPDVPHQNVRHTPEILGVGQYA